MGFSLPGFSVHVIFQARILEFPFPPLGDLPEQRTKPTFFESPHWKADCLPLKHLGSPTICGLKSISNMLLPNLAVF